MRVRAATGLTTSSGEMKTIFFFVSKKGMGNVCIKCVRRVMHHYWWSAVRMRFKFQRSSFSFFRYLCGYCGIFFFFYIWRIYCWTHWTGVRHVLWGPLWVECTREGLISKARGSFRISVGAKIKFKFYWYEGD